MEDMLALLALGEEDDGWDKDKDDFNMVHYDDDEINDENIKKGSDEESEISNADLRGNHPPKTPYFNKKRDSLNTPTLSMEHFGNKTVGLDTPDFNDKHNPNISWDFGKGNILDDIGMEAPNIMNDSGDDANGGNNDDEYDDDGNNNINTMYKGKRNNKLCGISIRKILKLNRDDVYDERSPIYFGLDELATKFKKKMGKEFCLNAAAAKLIFIAGLQDKGCPLDNEQLNIVHYGVEQFLSVTEYDLPSAVAKWITYDETKDDKTSRKLRDDKQWELTKNRLPTYLKHELIAFIFGETYFDLTDESKNKQNNKRRKKGEPVIHRNTTYIGSCVSELHDINLPKKHYKTLIWGFARESCGDDDRFNNPLKGVLYCISFYMPLTRKPPDENGNLEIKSFILDRTWHPSNLSATEGFNEYDNIRVRRTGRITSIPFEHSTGRGGILLLKVYGELFIERHATLDVDSCGYCGGWQYESQGDSIYRCGKTGKYSNFGGGGGGYYGGGGGYGSKGAKPKSDHLHILNSGDGGKTYGDRYVHLAAYMGSGGGAGGGKFLYSRGGRGGGCIVLIAGCIHNKGRIMSLGQRGRYLAGSGSGGSIIIECNSYYHYGKGAILASSLEPYPDIEKKQSGGIGGCGRVSIRINRQKWTTEMRKAICTNNIKQIWNPSAWIYPIPKWVTPDKMNNKHHLNPKLIGFHKISRIVDNVYKHCTFFRDNKGDEGALINRYSRIGQQEEKELNAYKVRKANEKKSLFEWKFDEFALPDDTPQKKNAYVSYERSNKS